MNIKAIIATVVLGSSSVAMAAPAVTFTAGTTVVRDHRVIEDDCAPGAAPVYSQSTAQPIYTPASQPYYTPVAQPSYGPSWWRRGPSYQPVTLATGLHFDPAAGRVLITNPERGRLYSTLKINAEGSRTFVKQVYIEFRDGQKQVIQNVNAMLTGNQGVTLDLDGNRREIVRVVVYGKELNSGWRRASNGFSLTAV